MAYILSIDQGTTSSRAIVYDDALTPVASGRVEFEQHYPRSGWVEHEPEDIWQTTLTACHEALRAAGLSASDLSGIGITNQRETTVVWDARTGQPIHRAIVWQDRRTAPLCARLREEGREPRVTEVTGLLIDPYFSATKIAWLLEEVPGARARAEAGELRFGTVDSWLIWRLTGGRVHATDATNACRTLLFDIRAGGWSAEACELFGIPQSMLPEIRDCAAPFGETDPDLFGAPVPILGVAGDQQAATLGQACFTPGMLKATYGTGCFALLNTGAEPVLSRNRLLTTVAYQLNGRRSYALEGAIFIAGAVVQWMRDGLGLIGAAPEINELAAQADADQDVVLVPAFTGLGAPYWDPDCRGAAFGLTRNTGPAELARAALESVAFQTRDLREAMLADWTAGGRDVLRVDGGMSASDPAMQGLADILGAPVDRPVDIETTARGAAWLAGLQAGLYPGPEEISGLWRAERRFEPVLEEAARDARYARWKRCVAATMSV